MSRHLYCCSRERPFYLDGRGLKQRCNRTGNGSIYERPFYLDGRGLKLVTANQHVTPLRAPVLSGRARIETNTIKLLIEGGITSARSIWTGED